MSFAERRRAWEARLRRSVGWREASGETAAPREDLCVVLDGGGARAAYQVGLLRGLVRRHPTLRIPMLTGVSAGAINASFLAAHQGTLSEAVDELTGLWTDLDVEQVFRVDIPSLASQVWTIDGMNVGFAVTFARGLFMFTDRGLCDVGHGPTGTAIARASSASRGRRSSNRAAELSTIA